MDKEKKIDELLAIKGDITIGETKIDRYKSSPITKEQRIKNKKTLRRLIVTGLSNDEIYEIMAQKVTPDGKPGPNMMPQTTRNLMEEIFAQMAEEADERKPYLKTMAQYRIHTEIRGAVEDGSWSAVANLEKVLSGIEGTQEPVEIQVEAGTRLTEAIIAQLNETEPAKIRELVERGKRLREGKELEIINVTPTKELEVSQVKKTENISEK